LEDDDGLSKLECFLQGYRRVTRKQACQIQVVGEPVVWVYKDSLWTIMDPVKVQKLIDEASPDKSMCAAIFSEVLKPLDYENLKFALDDVNIPDAIGLYEKDGQFAIVARLPHGPVMDLLHAQLAGVASGSVALGIGDYALRPRSHRTKLMIEYKKNQSAQVFQDILDWDVYRLFAKGFESDTLETLGTPILARQRALILAQLLNH
jgi:hypothetical protein